LGAMRNRPEVTADTGTWLLLPLLGAMRNGPTQWSAQCPAQLLPLLGAMRNPGQSGQPRPRRRVAAPLRGDEEPRCCLGVASSANTNACWMSRFSTGIAVHLPPVVSTGTLLGVFYSKQFRQIE